MGKWPLAVLPILLAFLVSSILGVRPATAQEDLDARLAQELRKRRLTQLSEAYSMRRLNDPKASAKERAAAALEVAGIYNRRAASELDATKRRKKWAEVDAILDAAPTSNPPNDVADFQRRLQHTLFWYERAVLMRDLMKVVVDDPEPAVDAKNFATKAADALGRLSEEMRRRINQTVGSQSWQQLVFLENGVRYHRGRAWAVLAQIETDPDEKTKAVAEAERLLREFVKDFSTVDVYLEARLTLAELYLAANRIEDGLTLTSPFESEKGIPDSFRKRGELVRAKLELAADRVEAALTRLDIPENGRVEGAEWPLALFEALLRGSQKELRHAKERQDRAMGLMASIESQYGRYWLARMEQTLVQYGSKELIGENPSLLRRVADLKRERKDFPGAIAAYESASRAAEQRGQADAAVSAAVDAAATSLQAGDIAGAVTRYMSVADRFPVSPLAGDALYGAAVALGRQLRTSKDPALFDRYKGVLERLLALPNLDNRVAGEAHWLHGDVMEKEKQAAKAIADYDAISPSHPRFVAAVQLIAELQHDRLLLGEQPSIMQLDEALNQLKVRLDKLPTGGSDTKLAASRCTATWVYCRLLALRHPKRTPEALELLTTDVLRSPGLSPELRPRALEVCLRWQLAVGAADAAKATANSAYGNNVAGLVQLLNRLSPIQDGISAEERAARAGLVEAVANEWLGKSDPIPDRQRNDLRLLLSQAYIAKAEYDKAEKYLLNLRNDLANEGQGPVFFNLARSAELAGKPQDAIPHWTMLRRGYRRGTDSYFKYTISLCRAYLKVGNRDAVLQIIESDRNLKVVPKTPELRSQLDALYLEASAK